MLDKELMLSVVGLEKTYQAKNKPPIRAVNNISFQVKKGTIVGILGPNGAGKTTTIKMLCGLILPDAGAITINGHDLAVERSSALRSVSAVLDGNRNIYWRLTVRENLAFFAVLKQRKTPRTLSITSSFSISRKNETKRPANYLAVCNKSLPSP